MVHQKKIAVIFGTNEEDIRADPCREHISKRVELDYGISHKITSHQKSYNALSATVIRPQDLYSGLLQEQVIDKICKRENGQLLIPAIPGKIQKCVNNPTYDNTTNSVSFEIVPPQISYSSASATVTTIVKTEFSGLKCQSDVNEEQEEGEKGDEQVDDSGSKDGGTPLPLTTLGLIIGACASLAIIVVIIVIACFVCSKKNRNEKEVEADVNPVYDGAADYDYDDLGNYDSIEVSTRRRREVRAELVDRSSIYGEKEEGWEGTLAVDNNPDYGE